MQGKKPTYQQRKLLEKEGLDPMDYLVQKIKKDSIQLINRNTGEVKEISNKLD